MTRYELKHFNMMNPTKRMGWLSMLPPYNAIISPRCAFPPYSTNLRCLQTIVQKTLSLFQSDMRMLARYFLWVGYLPTISFPFFLVQTISL